MAASPAFLGAPTGIPTNTPGARAAAVCRRPTSATLDGPPARPDVPPARPDMPPARPDMPQRPRPSAPFTPRTFGAREGRSDRGDRGSYSQRDERGSRGGYGQRDGRPSYGQRDGRPQFNRDDRRGPSQPFVADPSLTYYTRCGSCRASYEMLPKILGYGKKVACAVCGNEWYQKPERLLKLGPSEAMKNYPIEQKDELMAQQAEERRNRPPRRDGPPGGPRRDGYNQREGGYQSRDAPGGERREWSQRTGGSPGGYSPGGYRAGNTRHSVFIGNLPFIVTQEELSALIGTAGKVQRVSVVKDNTGRSKGFAFADMETEADVHATVSALDGHQIEGRTLTVRVGKKQT